MFVVALCALAPLSACHLPKPSHALIVRDPNRACALIRFSGCPPRPGEAVLDDDAGIADEDAGRE